ncbi:hypothetical protein OIU74_021632 [Salix koriyanagi]|uniref:Uncharacterized protein n=1 Tax=Salix koriyanagi TaxID=2511006 RepID=A0A9Q1AE80_9ROSI|nr:hypothetical protein OIU74_021632 [Salix koriyanagi]
MKWKRFLLIPVLSVLLLMALTEPGYVPSPYVPDVEGAAVPLQQEPLNNDRRRPEAFCTLRFPKELGFQRKDSHEDLFFLNSRNSRPDHMKDNNLQGQTWPLTTIDCGREDSFAIVTARMILNSISNVLNFSDIILTTPNIEKCLEVKPRISWF